MQGKSLYGLLSGKAAPDVHKSHVVSEYNDAMGTGTLSVEPNKYEGSHGSMYFDGRYKSIVYHGHDVGELYDLENDRNEFENLWFDAASVALRHEILKRHFDAVMATSDAGIRRTKDY